VRITARIGKPTCHGLTGDSTEGEDFSWKKYKVITFPLHVDASAGRYLLTTSLHNQQKLVQNQGISI
jgi:hypothetical protein